MVAHAYPYFLEQISPSMVQSVFTELKANGYSDSQIAALSNCLMEMASTEIRRTQATTTPAPEGTLDSAKDLLGLPKEFESLYLAGLM
jgi:hypothetical protein